MNYFGNGVDEFIGYNRMIHSFLFKFDYCDIQHESDRGNDSNGSSKCGGEIRNT